MLTSGGERLGSVQESSAAGPDENEESEAETDEEQMQADGSEDAQARGKPDAVEAVTVEDSKNEDSDEDDDSAEYETDSGSSSEYETESTDSEAGEQRSKVPVSAGGTARSRAVRGAHWPLCGVSYPSPLDGRRESMGSRIHLSSVPHHLYFSLCNLMGFLCGHSSV